MNTFKAELERTIAVTVQYDYTPPSRGKRDSLCGKPGAGPPLEPDDPGSIEINQVFDELGMPMELTDAEEKRLIQQIIDQKAEYAEPDHDPEDD